MGRIADDAPGHEGYMERELEAEPDGDFFARDETTGSWWCASWTSGLPDPTGRWRAACECGWRGDIVDHQAIADIDPDHSPGHDMLDETVEDLLLAPWEHHIDQIRSLPDLHTAARAADAAQRALDEAVHTARTAGHSWARIAGQVGLTRQAAHARWAAKVTGVARTRTTASSPPTHGI